MKKQSFPISEPRIVLTSGLHLETKNLLFLFVITIMRQESRTGDVGCLCSLARHFRILFWQPNSAHLALESCGCQEIVDAATFVDA
jgi:hypothetical protein